MIESSQIDCDARSATDIWMVDEADDGAAKRRSLVLRSLYAVCLIGATCNHAISIFNYGLSWDYGRLPRASATFWTMLVVLDPAAVLLLFSRPNAGVAATAAIIVADVVHNLWIEARYFPPLFQGLAESSQLVQQIAFMIFVIITAPFAWMVKRRTA